MPRVLFVLKQRVAYGVAFGLHNSANLVATALAKEGFETEVVSVLDNNHIDREVTRFKPDVVIIEALWVVPSKFEILMKLHPSVLWIVRLHSNTPFLAMESVAIEWLKGYEQYKSDKLRIACNHTKMCEDLLTILERPTFYLPNIYDMPSIRFWEYFRSGRRDSNKLFIDIGCFGAIRPLKNHLAQAIAAIRFANCIGKTLRFHINAGRVEQKGESVLKNLRSLFSNQKHQLIEHGWLPRNEFLELVASMDLGMQVSLSESFNIVSADFVLKNVPIVVSDEIDWMPSVYITDPNSAEDISDTLKRAWLLRKIAFQTICLWHLKSHNNRALSEWMWRFV